MKEYRVSVEVGCQGSTFETDVVVDSYTAGEARTDAEEQVRNNLSFNAIMAETEAEETGDTEIPFTVDVEISHSVYSMNVDVEVDAYTNSEALIEAEDYVSDNFYVSDIEVEENE